MDDGGRFQSGDIVRNSVDKNKIYVIHGSFEPNKDGKGGDDYWCYYIFKKTLHWKKIQGSNLVLKPEETMPAEASFAIGDMLYLRSFRDADDFVQFKVVRLDGEMIDVEYEKEVCGSFLPFIEKNVPAAMFELVDEGK
ncbi:MAG: hypothetical protein PHO09_00405 [Sphaerochaeta sp.]|nr:hypothetical protein [Sphaerochaeta sp.]